MFRPLLAKRFLLISSLFNMIHYIKFFFFRYKNKEINGIEEVENNINKINDYIPFIRGISHEGIHKNRKLIYRILFLNQTCIQLIKEIKDYKKNRNISFKEENTTIINKESTEDSSIDLNQDMEKKDEKSSISSIKIPSEDGLKIIVPENESDEEIYIDMKDITIES